MKYVILKKKWNFIGGQEMKKYTKFKDYMKYSFIKYAIALILLVFILFITSMFININFSTIKSNKICNRVVSDFVDNQCTSYYGNINTLSQNEIIKNALLKKSKITEVNYLLYNFCNKQWIKSNFILLDKHKNIVSSNLYKSNQELFPTNEEIQDIILKLNNNCNTVLTSSVRSQYDNDQNSNILFGKAVTYKSEIIGYLIFQLRNSGFNNFVINKNADIIIITDQFDNVIFSSNRMIIDSIGKYKINFNRKNITKVKGRPYYVTVNKVQNNNMKILTMTSIGMQQQFLLFGIIVICTVSIFLIILVIFLADKMTTRNLNSLHILLEAVSQCREGNMEYRIQSKTFEEFQILYDEFNNMMSRIQALIKKNNEISERKRLMEIKHLEGQFNPHFVFNVLETLHYQMLLDQGQASKMLISFANLMRYSINYGSTQVSIKTDIQYVSNYLMLQKMRYNKRLDYEIDIKKDLMNCKIPKLLIQPIVENSLVHGLESSPCITVKISGYIVEENMEICIEDNGQGIEESQLKSLLGTLSDENAMPEHIGLYNVHRALQLLYGKDYGITIESKYGIGTKVILKIPITESDDCV
ncbi:sensor histidine kinase [Clostridium lundense]|uniref:sensor histidine kinase n=1 Tax=Clostridium lundense TaxID=319475 RepID=UPI000688B287|nr:histidine kinase [Clostridium lundense]